MKLLEVKFEINCKLQVDVIIPPTLSPTEAWGEIIFLSYWPRQEAKAWPCHA